MAKETFWFKHDCNARGDRKMISLRKEMGMEGVGIYWCIVEMMYEEGGYLSLTEVKNIAYELRVKPEKISKVLGDFELFLNENQKVWSDSILERLNQRTEKSQKARDSVNTRYERTTDEERTKNDSTTNRVEKNREEKNRIDKSFDLFWDKYEKKAGKTKTQTAWSKLTDEERAKAMEHLKLYIPATPDPQYRKNPLTYLNQKAWEDEIIPIRERTSLPAFL